MAVEERQVTAEMHVEAVEMDTGVQLAREQAGCVVSATWLAANGSPWPRDRVPAADKLQNNNFRFLAYRWIAYYVAEQDESLHGRVDLQSASDLLKVVWPKGQ